MEMSPDIGLLAEALSKAQGEMGGAAKDSSNPFFNSKYADLASVWEACRKPLTKHGLSIVQFPLTSYEGTPEIYEWTSKRGETRTGIKIACTVSIVTRLLHESGQFLQESVSAMLPSADPQAVGSAITYLRRYALQSVAGVAPEDDDGEEAQTRQMPPIAPRKTYPGDGAETLLTLEQREIVVKAAMDAERGTEEIRGYLKRNFGIEGSKDIKLKDYRTILAAIAKPGELP